MPPPRFLVSHFVILLYLIGYIFALGPLGVRFNEQLALHPKIQKMVWMTVIEFEQETDKSFLSDQHLAGLVKDAFNELRADYKNTPWTGSGIIKPPEIKAPTMMVAITRGKRVYFASSSRSLGPDKVGFAYSTRMVPPPVQVALYECMVSDKNAETHKSDSNCGEPTAAMLAFNDMSEGGNTLPGSRVAAVRRVQGAEKLTEPCHLEYNEDSEPLPPYKWGCRSMVAALEISEIPSDTEFAGDPPPYKVQEPCIRLFDI